MTFKRAVAWLLFAVAASVSMHFGQGVLLGYAAGWLACLVWAWAQDSETHAYRAALHHVEFEMTMKPSSDVHTVLRKLDEEAKRDL